MKKTNLYFLFLLTFISASLMTTGCSTSNNLSRNYDSQSTFQSSNIGSISENNYPQTPDSLHSNNNFVTPDNKDIIRSGDQLQITVWGYPEFNTTTTVKDFGTVTIPLVGDVVAAGLSTDEFTADLSNRLTEYVKGTPKITVSHIDMNKRISVMGAVNKQDNYAALTDISLVAVIAQAGGPASVLRG